MRERLFIILNMFAAAMLTGCGGSEDMNILDAAAIYEANQPVIETIREDFPGPYADFVRVPARDPAKETVRGQVLLARLRQSFPVEFVDFFPIGNTGQDEINVVLKRYGGGDRWTVVSLVYAGRPIQVSSENPDIKLFDACDARAARWFEEDHGDRDVAAFCRINENWYAYQKVM